MEPRLLFGGDKFVVDFCSERNQGSLNATPILVLVCCPAIGHFDVHVPQVSNGIPLHSHTMLRKGNFVIATAVLSFTRRTALTAILLASER